MFAALVFVPLLYISRSVRTEHRQQNVLGNIIKPYLNTCPYTIIILPAIGDAYNGSVSTSCKRVFLAPPAFGLHIIRQETIVAVVGTATDSTVSDSDASPERGSSAGDGRYRWGQRSTTAPENAEARPQGPVSPLH